jgi:GNAT superfamily N-acetyltransferase
VERFQDELENLKPLLPEHYRELALDQDKVPLDPQFDIYIERENRGELLFIVARQAGQMVGYFIGFIAPGMHYKTCLTLTMDIFYIHPSVRGGGAGYQLFKTVETEARHRGVNRMFVGSKLHKDASWLFDKLGYIEIERYYSFWISA